MSQAGKSKNSKGKNVSFEDEVLAQAGPSSSASTEAAWTSSIRAGPIPPTEAPPAPSTKAAESLSIYRPVSRDYAGPPSRMQAAWAAAPKPKSFLEAISQTRSIRENTYPTPKNFGPLSGPVAKPPATVSPSADIITPPLHTGFPVYPTSTEIATGRLIQPNTKDVLYESSSSSVSSDNTISNFESDSYVSSSTALAFPAQSRFFPQPEAATMPFEGSFGTISSGNPVTGFGPGLYVPPSAALPLPVHPRHLRQPVGSVLLSEGSSSATPSDRSSPHLGKGLYASTSTAPASSLSQGRFIGPAPHTSAYSAEAPLVRTSSHPESGLGTVMDANTASPLRPAQVSQPAARPVQPPPNVEPGYYGPEPGYNGPVPESYGPGPGYNGPVPESYGPGPGYNGPVPESYGPGPGYNGPVPGYYGPGPGYNGPELGYYGPGAGYNGPVPGYYGLGPGYNGPEPGYYGPGPGYNGPEPGYYGPEPGPRNPNVILAEQPDYQSTYQEPFYDPRATYEYASQQQTEYIGFGEGSSHQSGGYQEPATYGPQPMQYVQPVSNAGYPQNAGQWLPPPDPKPPAVPPGFTASSGTMPAPFAQRETYAYGPDDLAVAFQRLQHTDHQPGPASLPLHDHQPGPASLPLQVRQGHLMNAEGMLQKDGESEGVEREEKRIQEEGGFERDQIERRGTKRARHH